MPTGRNTGESSERCEYTKTLYKKKGTVVILDMNNDNNVESYFPCPIDCTYQEGNMIWFVSSEDNSLWSMDIDTNDVRFLSLLPVKDNNLTYRMNTCCVKAGNVLFCLPDNADKILIFDILSRQLECCNIDTDEKRIGIYNAWKRKNKIWCISYFMQKIIEIDVSEKHVENMYSIFETDGMLIGYEAVMQGRYIYCVSRNAQTVCKFDTETKKLQMFNLEVGDKGFNTVAVDGDLLYLTGYKKIVYAWNERNHDIQILEMFPQEFKVLNKQGNAEKNYYNEPIFFRSKVLKEYVVFLPWNMPEVFSSGIIVYEKLTGKLKTINIDNERALHYYFCYQKRNDEVGIYCTEQNHILEIGEKLQPRYREFFHVSDLKTALLGRNKTIREERWKNLSMLIQILQG